ncbi:di-heme-cytochrome C peroxidase [Niveispirillum irakense]|uniref:di-heme-cytochrome C peroxidase n=1 Tax=Niveispirillum irakense TaxID=34011 RepID=UPI00041A4E2E|nr:di-heme-cytochrome C peroxidase [Niveispirillum irakense]
MRGVSAGILTGVALIALGGCGGELPDRPVEQVVWAEQGWTPEQRDFYHYTPQGTVIAPVAWFTALERPFSTDKLSDPAYLYQLGFLPAEEKSARNPLGLPVGFSVQDDRGPPDGKGLGPIVGFTCAACHTGQLSYQGKALRVDGGPAGANVTGFSSSFGISLIETYYNPLKWRRFAKAVLGDKYEDEGAYTVLKGAFRAAAHKAVAQAWYGFTKKIYPTEEGFTRLDALGRISNTVFGDDLQEPANYRTANAPVNYPHLWDIWKFDWVQYNGSVHQPMARNVGEALGVRARTNFVTVNGDPIPDPEKWDSSIPVHNLNNIEETLRSLTAPIWPGEIFGPYDGAKAEQGRTLFEANCSHCHAPRPYQAGENQKAEWAVTMVPLDRIGTDPTVAVNFAKEKLDASKLTGSAIPITPAQGLHLVTEGIKGRAYDLLGLDEQQRAAMDGFGRENLVRSPCGYKARPLDGVWATPPYLHNGSVPNIYELLSPQAERSARFWLGNYEYDPKTLGYSTAKFKGGFELDTSVTGNANSGHLFSDQAGPGVIGKALTPDERLAIIEYLKAMPDMPPAPLPPVAAGWDDNYPCKAQEDWWKPLIKG